MCRRTVGKVPLMARIRIWVLDLLLQSTVQRVNDSPARRNECRQTELQLLQTMHMVPQKDPQYLWKALKHLLRTLLATSWS